MKVLVIPDVHLKPWMFDQAEEVISKTSSDQIICLGDLVDDFGLDCNAEAYRDTLNTALEFEKRHPNMLWCYGNHDVAYLINEAVTGTAQSMAARHEALDGLGKLYDAVPKGNLGVVHMIDDVLFSHAGISQMYVKDHFENSAYNNAKKVVDGINAMELYKQWYNESPIWLRPQKAYRRMTIRMYRPRKYFQVVGHSPMHEITQENNLLTCDTFSTYRDGRQFGDQTFCLIDTKKWEWKAVTAKGEKQ